MKASEKAKSPASLLASMRWEKTTKEERSAHAKKMVDAREARKNPDKRTNAARPIESSLLSRIIADNDRKSRREDIDTVDNQRSQPHPTSGQQSNEIHEE